ncbi:MAG: nucleoid-associated protein, partial [Saprospiraceae bacterium]|nr:nucleoid-associated protein [Saprospiraceae bacterium]
ISDMVLGAQQRLYKIGCFVETKSPAPDSKGDVRSKDDFAAIVYDHQMSNTGDNNAARYFYGTFLGCRLADNSQRLTRVFYEETSKHIDESKLTTQKRVELKNDLVSYLKSQDNVVNPRTFAERYLPKSLQDSYFSRFKKAGFPARDVSKDNHQIRRKLQVRRMFFSSKVRISAPEENFNEVVQIGETKDGWTTVRINGELEAQT